MALTQAMNERLALLRAKARDNTMTQEDMREAIKIMREDRMGAAVTSAKAKERTATSRAKKNVDSDDLLSQLDGM